VPADPVVKRLGLPEFIWAAVMSNVCTCEVLVSSVVVTEPVHIAPVLLAPPVAPGLLVPPVALALLPPALAPPPPLPPVPEAPPLAPPPVPLVPEDPLLLQAAISSAPTALAAPSRNCIRVTTNDSFFMEDLQKELVFGIPKAKVSDGKSDRRIISRRVGEGPPRATFASGKNVPTSKSRGRLGFGLTGKSSAMSAKH